MFGARAVQKSILKRFPTADMEVAIIWINMLPRDAADTAKRSSSIVRHPRVRQYHDPKHVAGKAFADGLVSRGPAWDIYLFYDPGAVWKAKPPQPSDWVHQLSGGLRADPARFRTGDALVASLHKLMRKRYPK